jgi:hypothetical protein
MNGFLLLSGFTDSQHFFVRFLTIRDAEIGEMLAWRAARRGFGARQPVNRNDRTVRKLPP